MGRGEARVRVEENGRKGIGNTGKRDGARKVKKEVGRGRRRRIGGVWREEGERRGRRKKD